MVFCFASNATRRNGLVFILLDGGSIDRIIKLVINRGLDYLYDFDAERR